MASKGFTAQETKILTLASLGGCLEFYDFIIYGIFSIYFANQFFPSHNEFIVIIESYLVFILGYLARPVGGIIFSHIGDEYGRKKVLIITIVLMGIASLGIGFLPTYDKLGVISPLILLTLRLLQGLALGGELPSTYVYISESLSHKRGLAFGIVMTGVNFGLLLGMLINAILNYCLSTTELLNFGWRIPFIIGGLLCFISYHIRKTLHETTIFNKIHDKPKIPLVYLFKNHFSEFLIGTGMVAPMAALVVVGIIFMSTYLNDFLKLDGHYTSTALIILMSMNVSSIFITGLFAQKYNPFTILKTLLLISCLLIPLTFFLFYENHILFGLMILGFLEGMAAMITPYILTSLFEPKIHLTGVALSYNIAFTLFGGLSPVIITHFIRIGYSAYLIPALYLLVIIGICSICLVYYHKIFHSRERRYLLSSSDNISPHSI